METNKIKEAEETVLVAAKNWFKCVMNDRNPVPGTAWNGDEGIDLALAEYHLEKCVSELEALAV